MNLEAIKHFTKNIEIYEYVAAGPRTEDELKEYAGMVKMKTAKYDFIKDIKKGLTAMRYRKDGLIEIDDDILSELLECLQSILTASARTMCKNILIRYGIKDKVLLIDSARVIPGPGVDETLLDNNCISILDESYLTRDPFFIPAAEPEPEKELSKDNYQRRSIIKALKDSILGERVKESRELKEAGSDENEKPVSSNVEGKAHPANAREALALIRAGRRKHIYELLNDRSLTNQQKLALYAFYSDYHNMDMEKLINFAGDNNINADLLIQILEDPDRNCNYENTRDMLRTFKKSSEYLLKKQFARELLRGDWYITADYCGQETSFRLVPVEELMAIKELLDLPGTIEDIMANTETEDEKMPNNQEPDDIVDEYLDQCPEFDQSDE